MKKERLDSSVSPVTSGGSQSAGDALEYSIYNLLKKYQCTLSTAESATGGLIAATLVNVPGISEFFEQGYVTYSNRAKVQMIHVDGGIIDTYGVVSKETAAEMAKQAAKTAGTNAALSTTGVAGPDGGTKDCPVGTVYLGCYPDGTVVTERHLFLGDRQKVRESAVEYALKLLQKTIWAKYEE